MSSKFLDNQEQIFNRLQDNNINNENNATKVPKEKLFRLV